MPTRVRIVSINRAFRMLTVALYSLVLSLLVAFAQAPAISQIPSAHAGQTVALQHHSGVGSAHSANSCHAAGACSHFATLPEPVQLSDLGSSQHHIPPESRMDAMLPFKPGHRPPIA
jgi:hypothetical protein